MTTVRSFGSTARVKVSNSLAVKTTIVVFTACPIGHPVARGAPRYHHVAADRDTRIAAAALRPVVKRLIERTHMPMCGRCRSFRRDSYWFIV